MIRQVRKIQKKSSLLLLTGALILILTLSGCSGSAGSDKILANVNGTDITESQFNQRFNIIAGQYDFDPNNAEHMAYQEELKTQILNSIIDEAVLLEEAAKKGLTVEAQEIDDEIAMYKSSFSSQEEFTKYLSDYLKLNEEEFKTILQNDLLVSKLYAEVTGEINSTTSSPKEYFENNKDLFVKGEEVSATHILVEKEDEAKKIIEEINGGADMNQLAADKSIDPTAKDNKGELGYFAKGRMVPEFENVVFAMEVGELYPEPVKSQFGYHVIRLNDKIEGEDISFSDVEEEIKFYLIEEERNKAFSDYIDELRSAATIEMK